MTTRTHQTLAAACIFCATASIANAQTVAIEPVEEVIVTATRMEKELDRVPAAISVVTQDDIQFGRQQLALDEPLNRVPGIYMQNRFNFAQDLRISIRGFGARANFGIRGIKILVDGIPETLPDGQGSVDSIDLGASSRIEVLRGPSSSLWGNASGGVISVTSELAPAERFSEVRVTGGDDDYQKVQFKLGGQGERMGYLFSISDSSYDGYRDQSTAENTQVTGRLHFDLGRDREFLTVLNYTDQPVSDDPGALNLAELAADRQAARDVNEDFDAGEFLEQSRIGFVYNMPIGDSDHLSAYNYYAWRDFGNKLAFASGGIVELDRFYGGGGVNYTHDGTLGSRPNRVIVGFDLDDQDDDRVRFNNSLGGIPGAMTFDQNEHVKSYGLFAQDDLALSDNVDLSFGVRFDSVQFDVTDHFLADGDDSGNVDLDDVSPMLGIVFGLTDNVRLYGTYSSAFETPTTTEFIQPDGSGGFNDALKPQFATNLEVGVRGTIGGKHSYEVAVFNIEVDDELIQFEVPGQPGRFYYQNAGKSTRDGVEFSFTANPTARVSSTVSYTYSDFEYDEFIDAAGNDFAGNAIPGIGEHVLFADIQYRHERGWYAAFEILDTGDQYANNANSALESGYTLANLRLGWDKDLDSLTITPFLGVNNLTDETYNANIRINAGLGRYYEAAPGRNAYAGIGVTFKHR